APTTRCCPTGWSSRRSEHEGLALIAAAYPLSGSLGLAQATPVCRLLIIRRGTLMQRKACGALTATPMKFILPRSLTPWSGSHDGEGRSRICRSRVHFHGLACLHSEASGGVLARSLGQNLAALRIARSFD